MTKPPSHVTTVESFEQFHSAMGRYRRNNLWLFRGHASASWTLTPRAGRPPYDERDDQAYFEAWKRRAIEFLSPVPDNDWDFLAIAQHHGLATRLMDWSYYPLVAAFFAVSESLPGDAVVHCFKYKWVVDRSKLSPFSTKRIAVFKPSGVVSRIVRQGGLFTIHHDPTASFDEDLGPGEVVERVVIKESYRKTLLFELNHYGVNRSTLFPDLDGLSLYTNWCVENRAYWSVDSVPTDADVG
jgi:hypothetical protein